MPDLYARNIGIAYLNLYAMMAEEIAWRLRTIGLAETVRQARAVATHLRVRYLMGFDPDGAAVDAFLDALN